MIICGRRRRGTKGKSGVSNWPRRQPRSPPRRPMPRWGQEAPAAVAAAATEASSHVASVSPSRHPELEELPPLPADFEDTFLEAARRLRELAAEIKEQQSRNTMRNFGGSRIDENTGNSARAQEEAGSASVERGETRSESQSPDLAVESRPESEAAPKAELLPSSQPQQEAFQQYQQYQQQQPPQRPEGPARVAIEIYIPAHRAGLIIGHHGESLKRIEKISQCKVQFDPQTSSDGDRRVVIIGFPEDVEEAKRLIGEKSEEAAETRFPTIHMRIPQNRVGLVIGRGGETIRELQERSGARINVQPENQVDSWGNNERAVYITGDEASIRRAQDLINEMVAGHGRGVGGGGPPGAPRNAVIIKIPENSVGAVIGKRAETLRTLQNLSGCRIYVEPHSSSSGTERTVHLSGAPEQAAYAQQLIMERVTQNEVATAYYGSMYDSTGQPSVIYQNPAEFGGAAPAATMGGGGGMPAEGYDYARYYGMYYGQQQMPMAAGTGANAASYQPVDPSSQQQQQQPYDYAAYAQYYQQIYGGGHGGVPDPSSHQAPPTGQ